MEALFFNVSGEVFIYGPWRLTEAHKVSGGFLEGIVRGYKAGLLTSNHYANLQQCETLEGKNT